MKQIIPLNQNAHKTIIITVYVSGTVPPAPNAVQQTIIHARIGVDVIYKAKPEDWGGDVIECKACNPTEYNRAENASACSPCATCTDPANPTDNSQCTTWVWATGLNKSDAGVPNNSIFDYANATYGQSSCPWICDSGFYRGGTNNDECKQCPDHSTNCTSNGPSGLTAETVECDTNYQKFESDGVVTCKKCPDHSKYNPSTKSCECANGANGTFGANSNCQCANNSDYNENDNKCECTIDPYLNPTYDNDGVLTCSECATNATYDVDDNECKCNAGYYGNGDTHCEQCPPIQQPMALGQPLFLHVNATSVITMQNLTQKVFHAKNVQLV